MSALPRGSRAKLNQSNGRVDGATSESESAIVQSRDSYPTARKKAIYRSIICDLIERVKILTWEFAASPIPCKLGREQHTVTRNTHKLPALLSASEVLKLYTDLFKAQLDKPVTNSSLIFEIPPPTLITAHMAALDQSDTNTSGPSPKILSLNEPNSQLQLNKTLPLPEDTIVSEISQKIDRDDRSSSLSDIEDRHMVETTEKVEDKSSPISEDDDTEAETERLEESPQKLRKHENVLFTAIQNPIDADLANVTITSSDNNGIVGLAGPTFDSMPNIAHGDFNNEAIEQTSEISSLNDSADELRRATSPLNVSGRKRKRPAQRNVAETDSTAVKSLKKAAGQLVSNIIQNNNRQIIPEPAPTVKHETAEDHMYEDDEGSAAAADASHLLQPSPFSKHRGNRPDNRSVALDAEMTESRAVSPGIEGTDANGDRMDVVDSGIEDADMEDIIPGMDNDAVVRNEEEGNHLPHFSCCGKSKCSNNRCSSEEESCDGFTWYY